MNLDRRNATAALDALRASIDAIRDTGLRTQLRAHLDGLCFALLSMGWVTERKTR